eukprot:5666437-Prymnesium_polylepis.1
MMQRVVGVGASPAMLVLGVAACLFLGALVYALASVRAQRQRLQRQQARPPAETSPVQTQTKGPKKSPFKRSPSRPMRRQEGPRHELVAVDEPDDV